MHSIHANQTQQQQQQQLSDPNSATTTIQDRTSATMTMLEPVTQQTADRSSVANNLMETQLVQTTANGHLQPQQPILHQLQPTHHQQQPQPAPPQLELIHETSATADDRLIGGGGQSSGGKNGQSKPTNRPHNQQTTPTTTSRRNHQLEGIMGEGGGPIVPWLHDNYEIAEGESLPRSMVYNHYLAHCRRSEMNSVNAASFGKIIRSVFIGLKTRRLGTRGHSKYHYFGVRAKDHIKHELIQYREMGSSSSSSHHNHNRADHYNANDSNQNTDNGSETDSNGAPPVQSSNRKHRHHQMIDWNHHSTPDHMTAQQDGSSLYHHQQQNQNALSTTNGIYYTSTNSDENGPISHANGFSGSKSSPAGLNGSSSNGHHPFLASECQLIDFRSHLGANWATLVDEHWPPRDQNCQIAAHLEQTGLHHLVEWLDIFEVRYKEYYKRMIDLLSELKFRDVKQLIDAFWHSTTSTNEASESWQSSDNRQDNNNQTANHPADQQQENNQQHVHETIHQQQIDYQTHQQQVSLTFEQMFQLTSQTIVIERVNLIDYNLYAAIESFLLPDMLSPIPRPLTQSIRCFAKEIGSWIEQALKSYSHQFASEKTKSARAFGYALSRYTSLNLLSTASRAIWEKRSALTQMSIDLSQIDIRDIEHQVSLMSNHSPSSPWQQVDVDMIPSGGGGGGQNNDQTNSLIDSTDHHHRTQSHLYAMQPGQLIQNFLHLLEDPYPANSWPDWCRNLVESRVCGLSMDEARNFVLKWNFYISLIMKELTLRSSKSFGSFQLIRLLFDEYIFYLVVTRLAQAQQKTPAQLLSQ